MFGLPPGRGTRPRSLEAMLAESHEELRRFVEDELERRRRDGIPLDDANWRGPLRESLADASLALERDDPDAARQAVVRALSIVTPVQRKLEPRQARPELHEVLVRLRAVARGTRLRLLMELESLRVRDEDGDEEKIGVLLEQDRLMADFVRVSVAEVMGLRDDWDEPIQIGQTATAERAHGARNLNDHEIEVLISAGLLDEVFACAKRFQELPAPEKKTYGMRARSTSEPSGATDAPCPTADVEGATVERPGPTSQAPSTSTTPARDVSSCVAHG